MSSKSNQGSLNTVLGKLTINNQYDANSDGFQNQQTVISPDNMKINGYDVLTTISSKMIVYATAFTVAVDTPKPVEVNLGLYNFFSEANTIANFTYTGDSSSVYAQSITINAETNVLTITLNNDGGDNANISNLYINLYTPF